VAAGPGSLLHLAFRFFDAVGARPLTGDEEAWIASRLGPGELALFSDQPVQDQRHGFEAARWVDSETESRPDLVRAAMLHDIGKRHARLGILGRVVASLAMKLRIPLTRRFARYRDHGPLGGDELRALGVESLVWKYARCHHGPPDPDIETADLAILDRADRVRPRRKAGIRDSDRYDS
jgi:hypothetical protein